MNKTKDVLKNGNDRQQIRISIDSKKNGIKSSFGQAPDKIIGILLRSTFS